MTEITVNAQGNEVSFCVWSPSDGSQNYSLKGKYLTKNCSECSSFISKKDAVRVVEKQAKTTPHKWTKPPSEMVLGFCIWGKYVKILVQRTKGPRKCEYFGKERQNR